MGEEGRRLGAAVTGLVSWGRRWHRARQRVYATRRFVVIRTPLAGPPAADRVGEITFRHATARDLASLDRLEAYGRGSTQRAFVTDRHDVLFVASHDDRIVATRRCSHEIRDPIAARVVTLGVGQMWGADIFCLPEYRSQGLGGRLVRFADRQLASEGYTEVLAVVDASNLSSLRLSVRKESELAYYVSCLRMLSYERVRISTELPSTLLAELVGTAPGRPE